MKKILALFLTLTIIIAIASCGKTGNDKTTDKTIPPDSTTNNTVDPIDHSLIPGKFEAEAVTSSVAGENAVVLKKYNDAVTELIIPDTYVEDGVTYTVLRIGLGPGYVVPENSTTLQKLIIRGGKTKTVSGYSFQLCESLINVEIGSGVETIGELAFFGCSSLSRLSLPDTLKNIEAGAFGRTSITELVIPNSVEEIGTEAFANCKSLKKVSIPKKFNDETALFEIFLSNYKNIEFTFTE